MGGILPLRKGEVKGKAEYDKAISSQLRPKILWTGLLELGQLPVEDVVGRAAGRAPFLQLRRPVGNQRQRQPAEHHDNRSMARKR